MDHPAHELDTDAYRALSSFHQIPSIDDDGVAVSESAAILLYLAKKAGKLIPPEPAGEAQVTASPSCLPDRGSAIDSGAGPERSPASSARPPRSAAGP